MNCDVHEVSVLASNHRFVASRIESGQETASFLVTNLSTIIQQWHQWKELLPMVEPFYGKKHLLYLTMDLIFMSNFSCEMQSRSCDPAIVGIVRQQFRLCHNGRDR